MLYLPLLAGLFIATACNDDSLPDTQYEDKAVDNVSVNPTTITIGIDDEAALTATVLPQDAADKSVTWSTGDPSVVSVSETGVIKGLAEGCASITVTTTDGGKTATCDVVVSPTLLSVEPYLSAVTFSADGNTLYDGDGEVVDTTFRVVLAREVEWDVEMVGGDWCTVEKDTSAKTFTLKASANESETVAPDDVVVRVTAEDRIVEMTVSQKTTAYDVYVCGTIFYETYVGTAVYWKNGEMVELGTRGSHSYAKQILEYNGDIYILGGKDGEPGYWKNDEFIALTRVGNAEAYRMQITDGDVHIAGYDGYMAAYWKNGNVTQLETTISYGYGLCVDGGNVYVVGTIGGTTPTIWKNGVAETFSDSGAAIYAIHIENGNTYIGGTKNDCAKYWINGTMYSVATEYESYIGSNGMTIHNGRVYLAGEDLIDYDWYTFYASYWVDGEFFSLKGDPAYPSAADSIKFFGDDMYVVGHEKDYDIINHACYWKNGEIVILDTQTYDTEATDILVRRAE